MRVFAELVIYLGVLVFVAAWVVGVGSWFVGLYHLVRSVSGLFETLLIVVFKKPVLPEHLFATRDLHYEKMKKARQVFFVSWLVGMTAGGVIIGLTMLINVKE